MSIPTPVNQPSSLTLATARRVDAQCQRFEAAWKAWPGDADRPRLEDFLGELAEPGHSVLLSELLRIEVHHRRRVGEQPLPDDYLSRFPALARSECDALLAPDPATATPFAPLPGVGEPPGAAPNLPGYEILGEVGRGGMGVVYKARDVRLNRIVALKMILHGRHAGQRASLRQRCEAEAAAQLQHPNIVQIYEVGEHAGRPYLALEFVAGGSLDRYLVGTPQPASSAARLVETLARALDYAHQRGIVHRDLKPANILLAVGSGPWTVDSKEINALASSLPTAHCPLPTTPKITDFGLAKILGDSSPELTQSGEMLGTPSYMAPEQTIGKTGSTGPAIDVYGLGALLYELLTGRPPFRAESQVETLMQVRSQEPVSPSQLQPNCPRDLVTICLKCLHKEPRRRYATARELAEDLRRFLAYEPIHARPVTVVEKAWRWCRRQPAIAGLVAALVLVFLSGFAGVAWKWREALTESAAKEQALHDERDERLRKESALDTATTNLYFHQVALADREWLDNNVGYVEQLLAECPPERRHWEWYYVQGLCRSCLRSQRDADAQQVLVLWRDEETCIGLSNRREDVRLWNAATGDDLGRVDLHGGFKIWQGLLPIDRRQHRLVCPSDKNAEMVPLLVTRRALRPTFWDAATSGPLTYLQILPENEYPVSFSRDGRHMLTTQSPHWELQLRDTSTGQIVSHLRDCEGWHVSAGINPLWGFLIDFSPDGRYVAVAVHDSVRIWEVATGAIVQTLHHSPRTIILRVCYRPDGKQLAAAGSDQRITLWEVENGKEGHVLRGHSAPVTSLDYSPDGRQLASGSSDRSVRIWDVETGLPVRIYRGHAGGVAQVQYSPSGNYLASVGHDGTVKRWNAQEPQEAHTLGEYDMGFTSIAYSPTGASLLSGGIDGRIRLWDLATRQSRLINNNARDRLNAVAFAPDGQQFAAAGEDTRIEVHAAAGGEPTFVLLGHTDAVYHLVFHPRVPLLASASRDKTVKLWDLRTGRLITTFTESTDQVPGLAFSPDGRLLAVASWDRLIRIYDWEHQRIEQTLTGHNERVIGVAFHPDGRRLASASADKTVRIWDVDSGRTLHVLAAHAAGVRDVAFTPDGQRLASASLDGTVKLWDPATGRLALTLRGHRGLVMAVAFAPLDGQTLASASNDHTIRLWRAPRPPP